MTRKRKRLVVGDTIVMLAEPRKRSPVRIDRSVPRDYEEYVEQRAERERLAARERLLATVVAPSVVDSVAPAAAACSATADRVSDDEAGVAQPDHGDDS